MGKIRVKTIGDEEVEKKDLKKEQARAEAKKAKEAAAARKAAAESTDEASKTVAPEAKATPEKAEKKQPHKTNKKAHSTHYNEVATKVEKNKKYSLTEALPLLEKVKLAKFDETVELHINTTEKGLSGSVTLPHGTGKETRVVIANAGTDPKHVEELVKNIESGKIDFDILIATPETMPKLAKVARVLGPRGLMPNPKNGTVTPKPEVIAKQYAGGQINFKTEAKHPIMHMAVGKVSFGEKKLAENIKTAITAVKPKNIKTITLASTMSPGIKLDTASL